MAGLFAACGSAAVGRRDSLSAHRTRHASAPSADVLVDDTSTGASSDETFVKHETPSEESLFDEIVRDLPSDVGLTPRTKRANRMRLQFLSSSSIRTVAKIILLNC